VDNLRSRTVVAAALVDTAFSGDVSSLQAVAAAPAFVHLDRTAMAAYLRRLQPLLARSFSGGIGWIDRQGMAEVSSNATRPRPRTTVPDGPSFRRVLGAGGPFVGGGLIARRTREPVVVVAVPTRDADGHVSGVLAASIRLRAVRSSQTQLDLGYAGLEVLDRNGKSLLDGLARPKNARLVARLSNGSGAITGTHGLDGMGDHVVAYATAPVPGWRIVIDRRRSEVDAAAFHSLLLQLASVAAVALLVVALVVFVVRRSRRDHELQESRARAWRDLIGALGAAATPDEVAAALLASLSAAFPGSLVVVALDGIDGTRETRASPGPAWWRITADRELMTELVARATSRRESVLLDRTPALRPLLTRSGRRLRCLHTVPLRGADAEVIGGIALVRSSEDPLDGGERALLQAFAGQAARRFERQRRSALRPRR